MTAAILDASALLAFLRDEPGASRVAEIMTNSAITAVNFGEVVGHFSRNGAAEAEIRRVLEPLPVGHIDFDRTLAYMAGLLLPRTRSLGLSFGDRACLAAAQRLGVAAITADRSWLTLAKEIEVAVELIR